jgi:hypothetical protein
MIRLQRILEKELLKMGCETIYKLTGNPYRFYQEKKYYR